MFLPKNGDRWEKGLHSRWQATLWNRKRKKMSELLPTPSRSSQLFMSAGESAPTNKFNESAHAQ
jgi:hypothetical protein